MAHATSIESGAKGEGLVIRPRSNCKIYFVKLLLLYISGYVKDKITFISSVNPELQIILAIIQLSNPQSNFLAC